MIKELEKIVGKDNILTAKEELKVYSKDATHYIGEVKTPVAVVFPTTTNEVSKILKLCNETKTNVITRGAGTNMCAACVDLNGSVILNLTKMNKIYPPDKNNFTIKAQAGAVISDIQKIADENGLFYPPDPSSCAVATLGGTIATSAGGSHTLKYGTTKDYVLSLEVVLADGTIFHTGSNLIKDVSGYNLTQLFTGSEGTLGVVCEATLKLIPKVENKKLSLIYFNSVSEAANAVIEILRALITPSVIDFMDKNTLQTIENFCPTGLLTDKEGCLLVEVDGFDVDYQQKKVEEACKKAGAIDIISPQTEEETQKIWLARRSAFASCTKIAPDVMSQDIVVPKENFPEMAEKIQEISKKYNIKTALLAHAGDGNIHPHFIIDLRDKNEVERFQKAKDEMFEQAIKLGGTLSGEHGIGEEKKKYLQKFLEPENFELQKKLKKFFDANNILNSGKIFQE